LRNKIDLFTFKNSGLWHNNG
jgi:hypothetical protein